VVPCGELLTFPDNGNTFGARAQNPLPADGPTPPFPDCLFETSPNSSYLVRSRRHFKKKHFKIWSDEV